MTMIGRLLRTLRGAAPPPATTTEPPDFDPIDATARRLYEAQSGYRAQRLSGAGNMQDWNTLEKDERDYFRSKARSMTGKLPT